MTIVSQNHVPSARTYSENETVQLLTDSKMELQSSRSQHGNEAASQRAS